ncbi:hypothetical protein T439DRAFT_326259 [Meredithblackwellia eburnea MCA 4105]
MGEEGVKVGSVLPRLEAKLAEMQVEVLHVAGHELTTVEHSFDTATPGAKGSSTIFTKFLVPASSSCQLGVSISTSDLSIKSNSAVQSHFNSLAGSSRVGRFGLVLALVAIVVALVLSSHPGVGNQLLQKVEDKVLESLKVGEGYVQERTTGTAEKEWVFAEEIATSFAVGTATTSTTVVVTAATTTIKHTIPTSTISAEEDSPAPFVDSKPTVREDEERQLGRAFCFDWSMWLPRILPAQLGLRSKEIVLMFIRWFGF